MTKKDFELIAGIVKYTFNIPLPLTERGLDNTRENVVVFRNILVSLLSEALSQDYRFDYDKFLIACGLGSRVNKQV